MHKKISPTLLRNIIQMLFVVFLAKVGWQFYRFVQHYETFGQTPAVAKPPAVEAFLPISALISLKVWLTTGIWDSIHPAGLAILLAIILISVLWRRGFCSWICPIGTLSEGLYKLGKYLFTRNFSLPIWLDWPLLSIKYLLLGFFVKAVFLDFSPETAQAFLKSPYNMIADVKMLKFFTNISPFAFKVLIGLAIGSLFIKNFWCRYLCPYGALVGILNLFSPTAINRDKDLCTDCLKCTKACPNEINVAKKQRVWSSECTMCLSCVEVCPAAGALQVNAIKRKLPALAYPAILLGTFFLIIVWAKITGKWESSIPTFMYEKLIPLAQKFNH